MVEIVVEVVVEIDGRRIIVIHVYSSKELRASLTLNIKHLHFLSLDFLQYRNQHSLLKTTNTHTSSFHFLEIYLRVCILLMLHNRISRAPPSDLPLSLTSSQEKFLHPFVSVLPVKVAE